MKVLSVVGARPQFVKLGPIAHGFAKAGDIEHVIEHVTNSTSDGRCAAHHDTAG